MILVIDEKGILGLRLRPIGGEYPGSCCAYHVEDREGVLIICGVTLGKVLDILWRTGCVESVSIEMREHVVLILGWGKKCAGSSR